MAQRYVRINDEIGEFRTKEFMIVFGEHLRAAFEHASLAENDSEHVVERINQFFAERLDTLLPEIFNEHRDLLQNSFRKVADLSNRLCEIDEVIGAQSEGTAALFVKEMIKAKLQNAFVMTESSKNLLETFSLKPKSSDSATTIS